MGVGVCPREAATECKRPDSENRASLAAAQTLAKASVGHRHASIRRGRRTHREAVGETAARAAVAAVRPSTRRRGTRGLALRVRGASCNTHPAAKCIATAVTPNVGRHVRVRQWDKCIHPHHEGVSSCIGRRSALVATDATYEKNRKRERADKLHGCYDTTRASDRDQDHRSSLCPIRSHPRPADSPPRAR